MRTGCAWDVHGTCMGCAWDVREGTVHKDKIRESLINYNVFRRRFLELAEFGEKRGVPDSLPARPDHDSHLDSPLGFPLDSPLGFPSWIPLGFPSDSPLPRVVTRTILKRYLCRIPEFLLSRRQ